MLTRKEYETTTEPTTRKARRNPFFEIFPSHRRYAVLSPPKMENRGVDVKSQSLCTSHNHTPPYATPSLWKWNLHEGSRKETFSAKPFPNSSKRVMFTIRTLRKKRWQHAYASQHQTRSENSSTTICSQTATWNGSAEAYTKSHKKDKNY